MRTPDSDQQTGESGSSSAASYTTARTFLAASAMDSYLPTPRASSPISQQESDETQLCGRERRVRKSINYAEPKLNTSVHSLSQGCCLTCRSLLPGNCASQILRHRSRGSVRAPSRIVTLRLGNQRRPRTTVPSLLPQALRSTCCLSRASSGRNRASPFTESCRRLHSPSRLRISNEAGP